MLHCGKCQQTNAEDNSANYSPASVGKARTPTSSNSTHTVYVFCIDCNEHLCERCDYITHENQYLSNISDQGEGSGGSSSKRQLLKQQETPQEEEKKYRSEQKLLNNQHHDDKHSLQQIRNSATADQTSCREDPSPWSSKQVKDKGTTAKSVGGQKHTRKYVCEECFGQQSETRCPTCEQNLCRACWGRIHNKGTRRKHRQRSLKEPPILPPNAWKRNISTSQYTSIDQESSELRSISNKTENSKRCSAATEEDKHQLPSVVSVSLSARDRQNAAKRANPLQHYKNEKERAPSLLAAGIQSQEVIENSQSQYNTAQQNSTPFLNHNAHNQTQPSNYLSQTTTINPGLQINLGQNYPAGPQIMPPNISHPYQYHIQNNFQAQQQLRPPPQFHPSQFPTTSYNQIPNQPQNLSNLQSQAPENQHSFPQPHVFDPAQQYAHYVAAQEYHRSQSFLQQTVQKVQTQNSCLSDDDFQSQGIHEEAAHQVPGQSKLCQNQPKYAAFRQSNIGMSSEFNEQQTADQTLRSSVSKGPAATSFEQVDQNKHLNYRFKQPLPQQKSDQPLAQSQIQNTLHQNDSNPSKEVSYSINSGEQWTNPNENALYYNPMARPTNDAKTNASGINSNKFKPQTGQSGHTYRVKQISSDQNKIGPITGTVYVNYHHQEYFAEGKKGPHLRDKDIQGKQARKPLSDNSSIGGNDSDYSSDNVQHHSGTGSGKYGQQYNGGSKNNSSNSFDYYGGYNSKHHTVGKHRTPNNVREKSSNSAHHQNTANTDPYKSDHRPANTKTDHGQSGPESDGSFNTEKQAKRGIIRMSASEAGSSLRVGNSAAGPGKSSSGHVTHANSNQSKKSGTKFPRGQLVLNNEMPKTETVPVRQPVIPIGQSSLKYQRRDREEESKLDENEEMKRIQLLLFDLAKHGELLVLKENFISQMKDKLDYSEEKCHSVIERAETHSIIHQTIRNFANSQKIELVSLKIQVLSHQCLQWVITSLRRDEMTPTEAAIKNRIKEAFALKIYEEQWETIMNSIRAQQSTASIATQNLRAATMQHQQQQSFRSQQPDKGASGHTNRKVSDCSNDSEISTTSPMQQQFADTGSRKVIDARHAQWARASQSFMETRDLNKEDQESSSSSSTAATSPRFKIIELPSNEEDPQNSAVSPIVKAIYMEDEEVWQGVDIDDESTVDRELFQVMKDFLKEYFCVSDHAQSSSDGIELQSSAEGGRRVESTQNHKSSSGENTSNNANHANALNNEGYGIGPDVRTIPGGRYGCTQYLKICGPKEIRACSVGKTTQMVQLAIKQDVLRHHKTLIVWSTQVDKHKTDQDQIEDQQKINLRQSKLSHVRQALIEILAESKNGMSLAQLPQYLKKKLPFTLDLNELGFPKLKDLLKSMDDEIKIELKDVNHPFAYLLHTKNYEKCRDNRSENTFQLKKGSLFKQKAHHLSQDVNVDRHMKNQMIGYGTEEMQQILSAFYSLLRKHPMGILSTEMNQQISEQVSFQFSHTHLNCKSEYEFVKKYIMPGDASIEFIYEQQRRKQDNANSQEVVRQLFWVRSRTIVQEYILNTEQQRQLNKSKESKSGSFSSSQSQQIFQEPQIQSVPCQTEVSNDLSASMASGGPQPRPLQTQPQHNNTGESLAMPQNYIPTCETLYGSVATPFSGWSEFSHIRHQSNMTIDSSNCNTGKQLLSHLNRDHTTPTAYPSSSQPVNYQQPFSHSVFGQNPAWNAYPPQRPEQVAQVQMSQKALNAPSYNPSTGFEPHQEAHQHHQSQGAPILDRVQVNLHIGNGQSRNGPPQRQQVQSQVIQDRYELFDNFGQQPSEGEHDDAVNVSQSLQDLIGNQDDPTGAVNSLFNSPEQERQNMQSMHGVQGGYPNLQGDRPGHFGTQDNVKVNQYSDLMLNSYHQPSDDSSFANQSIFNEHQPLFAKLPGAKPGSVKSQAFDTGLLESKSSASLYQPNSMSNQRDYPQDYSLFTGGPTMNQDRDKGEQFRGGFEKSILSMQEKDSYKFSRGYEAPMSEGHFQKRQQNFFQGNSRNVPHTQVRITEENSGGDCSTNKSPDAREEVAEIEPQIVEETGQEPERHPQTEDEKAKLI